MSIECASPPAEVRSEPCQLDRIPVSTLGEACTLDLLTRWMEGTTPRRVATANLDFLRLAHTDNVLRGTLQTADLVTADGWPLVALSRLTSSPVAERVAGSDLVPALLKIAADRGLRVYFLGSTDQVMARALEVITQKHPELEVAGHASPFVDWDDAEAVTPILDAIRETRPDLLLVALGCPRQDLFLARHIEASGASLGIGIGGTLDFIAGHRIRAPRIIQRLGLEWLVRLAQEPRRLLWRYWIDFIHFNRLVVSTWRDSRGLSRSTTVRP